MLLFFHPAIFNKVINLRMNVSNMMLSSLNIIKHTCKKYDFLNILYSFFIKSALNLKILAYSSSYENTQN